MPMPKILAVKGDMTFDGAAPRADAEQLSLWLSKDQLDALTDATPVDHGRSYTLRALLAFALAELKQGNVKLVLD